jgi:hypothetical protein
MVFLWLQNLWYCMGVKQLQYGPFIFYFFILFWIVFGMVLSHLFFSLNKMTVMSLCVFSHTRHNQGHFGKLMIIPNIAKQVKSCRLIK